jgi:hypothetical protein
MVDIRQWFVLFRVGALVGAQTPETMVMGLKTKWVAISTTDQDSGRATKDVWSLLICATELIQILVWLDSCQVEGHAWPCAGRLGGACQKPRKSTKYAKFSN